jgi:predicted AlkP superfamily phosphohydrolase/phosphomutase
MAEVADILSSRLGRPVQHVDPPLEQWQAGAVQSGIPEDYVALLGSLFTLIASGGDAHLSTGVQDALGRRPGSFQEWADRELAAPAGAQPAAAAHA